MPIIIYGLMDPRTSEIRYVGKTSQPIQYRISAHMRDTGHCHRTHWLRELAELSMRPGSVVLEVVPSNAAWQDREKWWIAEMRRRGALLTNNTDGGDGVTGLPAETRERMARVWLGRKHSPETIAKLCAARVGFRHKQASKDRMREIMKDRKITWGEQIADAVSKLSEDAVRTIKDRLDSGTMVKDIALEYGLHRTTVSKIKMGTYAPKRKKDA